MTETRGPKFRSMLPNQRRVAEDDMRAFGIALETARRALGYSVESIADSLRVTPQTVRHYERGQRRPSAERRAELVSILGIGADEMKAAHAALKRVPPTLAAATPERDHA